MEFFSTNEIKPTGWLKQQLETQAYSLAGNLDKIWKDVKDSAWIGGDAEGWERVPYWLDGFIPLSYLLDNKDMKLRAKKYIDGIISAQSSDGWLCPCAYEKRRDYDLWALFLICKVLVVYYECSKDERIPEVVENALYNLYHLLDNKTVKLKDWGKYRWFECFISINWLYKRTNAAWLVSLAKILNKQGAHYEKFIRKWKHPKNRWRFDTHIVNIVMALKEEAITYEMLNKPYTDRASRLGSILRKYNGTAVGTFTGDECLSGTSPIQGTELCSVVEQMYSYELLFRETGESKWADLLDLLAFNALPAACSEDMWTHQYDQMANQIECTKFKNKPIFRTNGADAHIFGLEPNFGCCTANMGQGWPKFAQSSFMKSKLGIVSVTLAPALLITEINGCNISIELISNYPFSNKLKYIVKTSEPVEFDFSVRIPYWSHTAKLNGKAAEIRNGFIHISKEWNTDEVLNIELFRDIEFVERPHNLYSIKYGPIIFSLPVKGEWKKEEYTKDGVERKFPYCDYEIHRKSDWNYAFASSNFSVIENETGEYVFSEKSPPLQIKAVMQKIEWGYEKRYTNVCAKIPKSLNTTEQAEEILLQPYGTTTLRMTEMPVIK